MPLLETNGSFHIIVETGDIVLHLEDDDLGLEHEFRASAKCLRKNSKYFDTLLDPEKFAEGVAVQDCLQELTTKYSRSTAIPFDELPRVALFEIPELRQHVTRTIQIIRLFLFILHGQASMWPFGRQESMQCLAQLMLIADRFSATGVTKKYVYDMGLPNEIGAGKHWPNKRNKDLYIRCSLLSGLYLGESDWIRYGSARLIVEGSYQWSLVSISGNNDEDALPAWFHLPGGFEGPSLVPKIPFSSMLI